LLKGPSSEFEFKSFFGGKIMQKETTSTKNVTQKSDDGYGVGQSATDKVAFYGETPIAQPSATGVVAGFTAGSGTGANVDSTFTGNVGSTAYTISDVVAHLKNLGLLAK
jgi:hypothetical protein